MEINNRYCAGLMERNGGDSARTTRMSIIKDNQIHMATLCVMASHSVNGVSKLHSEIIKDSVFHEEYLDTPNKFKNVTNGIAYRRWLYQSNPGLTQLLRDKIGDGFLKDGSELKKLDVFADDKAVLEQLRKIKKENKERFAKFVKKKSGLILDTDSVFDAQVKRLHEYNRQHLNAMHILAQYNALLENPDMDFTPKTYIFAAKAAPGYYLAKQIIKMIWALSEEIRKNPRISDKLSVYFLENYCVTMSELLMPACDISEQISLAGTEASGTGNMKLMLNGAITLGTLDGANIEIGDAVGADNILIFGMKTEEVNPSRLVAIVRRTITTTTRSSRAVSTGCMPASTAASSPKWLTPCAPRIRTWFWLTSTATARYRSAVQSCTPTRIPGPRCPCTTSQTQASSPLTVQLTNMQRISGISENVLSHILI